MPFTRKTTRTYRPETFYRHFNDAGALQTCTHDAHARKTHAKRTRNAHETSTVTGGATLRSLPVPNPHCSPTNRTDPRATIFPISTPTRTVRRNHLPYLHPNPHCSPKFGLYRFFNIFLQNPYLLTWRIWRINIRTLPIFQHFSSKSLSFNMADLARHISTITTTHGYSRTKIESCGRNIMNE